MNQIWIRTASGRDIDIENPDPEQIDIEDIAKSLARQNRFNGHTHEPYNVAEHSVRVSRLVELWTANDALALRALLHDAAEAYIGDIIAPVKALLRKHTSAIDDVERGLEVAILRKFGVEVEADDVVKRADIALLTAEWRDHMPRGISGKKEPILTNLATPSKLSKPLSPEQAELEFLDRFEALRWATAC